MATEAPVKDADQAPGKRLIGARVADRYQLIRLIGVGAVGQVFEARQVVLRRPVAVKLVSFPAGTSGNEELVRRFALEGETLARLAHPNVVSIIDVGVWQNQGYLVMELLKGQTLAEVFEVEGRIALPRLLHIARQLCSALVATHRAGVIHRDLKPNNLLLTTVGWDDSFVKVIDFGIVKDLNADHQLTVQGSPLGTPRYMAPEQVLGATAEICPATDIYSVGAMLYRGAIGQTLFPNAQGMFQLIAQLREEPARFDAVLPGHGLPPAFEAVVRKCLSKKPADRFSTASELDAALAEVERGLAGARSEETTTLGGHLPEPHALRRLKAAAADEPTVLGTRAVFQLLVLALIIGSSIGFAYALAARLAGPAEAPAPWTD